ncbi:pyridoxamine 5'-phosphate oxidase family protein [Oleispirillum naphthae]|uniref:pyridoxamine 5'-phosphate oxidase family protein n=1 Tax=Oleispirillum naphthae TaxID=2838853 RepID=UPI00308268CA
MDGKTTKEKSPPILQTPRNTVQRLSRRASYDREVVNAILDDAYTAVISATVEGGVRAQPIYFWRIGDELYVHGSRRNALFNALMDGQEACLTVTLLDGLVMARSAFHHSMNYRSVVIYAHARAVTDEAERMEALKQSVERIEAGRWAQIRRPSEAEMRGTMILAFPIAEASAKARHGGPVDDPEDYDLPVWAGVLPCKIAFSDPIEDTNTQPPD